MSEPRICPNCGTTIPADATGGACPRCIMALAYATNPGGAPQPDVTAAEAQQHVPGYDVLTTLGRGGMGVVFRARQRALDREVALKVLPGGHGRPAGFTERFEREAKALARLQHPGIVQVFDFGTTPDGWCYLAMELVEGANLRRVLGSRRLSPKEALAIVPEICDALQYAHDHGVVHRDIKPENILLTADGRVKIADFGLAKLMERGDGAPGLTQTGHAMGTPLYMAPEQVEHPSDVDHRADIYSLGVVFYEMLTGELPIGRFPAPSKRSDVDARIDEIVLRTLEKEREARYQRAAEVKTSIGAAKEPAASPPPLVPAPERYPKPLREQILGSSPSDSRMSKLAVACLPVAAVAMLIGEVNSSSYSRAATGIGALVAAIGLCGIAAVRVRQSAGKLRGGLLVAIAALGAVVMVPVVLFHAASGEASQRAYLAQVQAEQQRAAAYRAELESRAATELDGVPVRFDPSLPPSYWTEDAAARQVHGPAIEAVIQRLQSLWPATAEVYAEFYPVADREVLSRLPAGEVSLRGASGQLGFPYFDPATIAANHASLQVVDSSITSARTRAVVTLTDGKTDVIVALERDSGTLAASPWRFSLAPVRTEPAKPRPKRTR